MPLKLLLDENLRHASIRSALAVHQTSGLRPLDVVRVGDPAAPILSTTDVQLLAWAAAEDRILISLDERTLQSALKAFLLAGASSPGIIVLRGGLSAADVVALLEMLAYDTDRKDWENACQWLP